MNLLEKAQQFITSLPDRKFLILQLCFLTYMLGCSLIFSIYGAIPVVIAFNIFLITVNTIYSFYRLITGVLGKIEWDKKEKQEEQIKEDWCLFLKELEATPWPWTSEKEKELYAKQDDIRARHQKLIETK